ncbi:alpha/beta hydrolase [Clostridium sp. Marseille-Q7071]
MERITFINSRNLKLVGNIFPTKSKSIIIFAHGFISDKRSKGRFPRLVEAFNQCRYNVLTFDFCGCGESDDDSITVSKEIDDLNSAIKFVKSLGYKKIGLYGHSLGSLICLIDTMVLSGALTGPMKYNWSEYFTEEQIKELNEKGYITENITEGIRKQVIIDKQMLMDFELTNQSELMKNIHCPILLIHGNNDEEEKLLCENSKRAMTLLPKESRLEIIDGADHSFLEYYDTLINLTKDWFLNHLES